MPQPCSSARPRIGTATSRRPTGSRARPRPRAPSSSCCRRSGRCSARPSRPRPARSRSTAPRSRGRAAPRASSGSTSSPARSPSASRAPAAARTPACTSAPTARTARSIARSTCSTSRSAAARTASPSTRRPATRSSASELADGEGLGLTICYDLRFPELFRILAVRGATVMTVPAAFTETTTRDHWEVLLRARAIEDQCFVVAANQIGEPAPGIRTGGRSMIVEPVGPRARAGARLRDVHPRRPRLRPPARGSGRSSRRSPTARPARTAGPAEVRA